MLESLPMIEPQVQGPHLAKEEEGAEAAAEEGEDELRQDKGAETPIPMTLLPSFFWAASSWEA